MLPTAEMILWAIHHATTLLFGVFASAALCGIEINRRHALELVMVSAVTGCTFGLANAVGGELFARQVYPLVVHLPLVIYLCARYRLSPLLAMLGVTSAYLSCQFSNWMGIAALAATDSQIAYYVARIITTAVVFAILLHWASDIGPRLAVKSPTELEILLILPLVYYIFDYATNVYTTLFHSGSVVTVEFLAFALCAFYLMFLAVYLREYEAKEIAERERWMLATRDSAAIKELEAWRQSGRELSVLRHDMRHFLRGLAALIEEGPIDEPLDRFDEVLVETPKVRKDMGYPPLVTPTSQMVGVQAVRNVLDGQRYKSVSKEIKAYCRGEYGRTPAPIDPEIQKMILGDEQPLTVRYADTLEPVVDKTREKLGDLARSDEDVLSYIAFPNLAEKFFEERKAKEENVATYSIVEC